MSQAERSPEILRHCDLVLNLPKQEVVVRDERHHLTPMECRLLATFMQHPGKTLSRRFLMREVWETDYCDDTRTIEVHVSWLRKKIEDDPTDPQLIKTVHGTGYIFAAEHHVSE